MFANIPGVFHPRCNALSEINSRDFRFVKTGNRKGRMIITDCHPSKKSLVKRLVNLKEYIELFLPFKEISRIAIG